MKKTLSLLAMLFAVHFSYAQNNSFPTPSGNATIGNGNYLVLTDPNANTTSGITWFTPAPANYGFTRTSGTWTAPGYQQLNIQWDTGIIINPGAGISTKSYVEVKGGGLRVTDGNIGIGTANPGAPLSIINNIPVIQLFDGRSNPGDGSSMGKIAFGTGFGEFSSVEASRVTGSADDISFLKFKTSWATGAGGDGNNIERMRINFNGNVGIGTTTPDQKLTVNGTIHSKEVKVDLNVPAPDYVFDQDYKLTSLKETKNYIDKNHHLPEMPSADQLAKDGLNLGEMNLLLLKKVEELTLHLIEKDKEIKELQQINHEQIKVNVQQQTALAVQHKDTDQLKQQMGTLVKEIRKK